jgi:hypothetical protein
MVCGRDVSSVSRLNSANAIPLAQIYHDSPETAAFSTFKPLSTGCLPSSLEGFERQAYEFHAQRKAATQK